LSRGRITLAIRVTDSKEKQSDDCKAKNQAEMLRILRDAFEERWYGDDPKDDWGLERKRDGVRYLISLDGTRWVNLETLKDTRDAGNTNVWAVDDAGNRLDAVPIKDYLQCLDTLCSSVRGEGDSTRTLPPPNAEVLTPIEPMVVVEEVEEVKKTTRKTSISGGTHVIMNPNIQNQNVENQINIDHMSGGTIYQGPVNFGSVNSREDVVKMFNALLAQVQQHGQKGELDEEVAIDLEAPIKKASKEAEKPNADKNKILGYVTNAKNLLENASKAGSAAAALGGMLGKALESIQTLF
jgi:hypothetical protein